MDEVLRPHHPSDDLGGGNAGSRGEGGDVVLLLAARSHQRQRTEMVPDGEMSVLRVLFE